MTLIHLEDKPRSGVFEVISELKDQAKLQVMMLTGDHKSSAWRVANAVGINEVYYSLKPEDKLNHVKRISRDMGEPWILIKFNIFTFSRYLVAKVLLHTWWISNYYLNHVHEYHLYVKKEFSQKC